jgi:hypothetical protein
VQLGVRARGRTRRYITPVRTVRSTAAGGKTRRVCVLVAPPPPLRRRGVTRLCGSAQWGTATASAKQLTRPVRCMLWQDSLNVAPQYRSQTR